MSLSQKHTRKVFVPWFNTAEWIQVYNILCSHSNKKYNQALNVLKLWKKRTPLLSAGVEGTLIILEALLTKRESLLEQQLTQIYAISIMRFLNLCATNNERQGTFYKTAIKNELPKWLINIRHDIAHDHKLPSTSVLQLGLHECLEWIKDKYWAVQKEIITDYVVAEDTSNMKTIEILKVYVQINSNLMSENIDISRYDENVMEKIDNIVYEKTRQATTDISIINNALEEYLNEYLMKLMNEGDKEHMTKIVVDEGLLYIRLEVTPERIRIIPKSLRNIWTNLLNILIENDFIPFLLNHLIDVTNDIEVDNVLRETAALWINELLLGLQKIHLIKEELDKTETDNPDRFSKANIIKMKSVIEEKYPELEDCLDFFAESISDHNDVKVFQDKMLNMPSNYTLLFLERALQYNRNSESYISDTVDLVKKMLSVTEPESNGEIYTVDQLEDVSIIDINNFDNTLDCLDDINDVDANNMETTNSEQTTTIDAVSDTDTNIVGTIKVNNIQTKVTRWKLVKDTSVYKNCPLGVLPHQDRDKNPVLIVI